MTAAWAGTAGVRKMRWWQGSRRLLRLHVLARRRRSRSDRSRQERWL